MAEQAEKIKVAAEIKRKVIFFLKLKKTDALFIFFGEEKEVP